MRRYTPSEGELKAARERIAELEEMRTALAHALSKGESWDRKAARIAELEAALNDRRNRVSALTAELKAARDSDRTARVKNAEYLGEIERLEHELKREVDALMLAGMSDPIANFLAERKLRFDAEDKLAKALLRLAEYDRALLELPENL